MPDLLDTWAQLKREADNADMDALERLTRAYSSGYATIDPQIQALTEQIDALQKSGKLTKAKIQKSAVYRNLMNAVRTELEDFSAVMRSEIRQAVPEAANRGLGAGNLLMLVAVASAFGMETKDIPADTLIEPTQDALGFLADYLNPEGVLYGKINGLPEYHTDQIAATILDLVSQGKNPKVIGEFITDAYGTGLTDSLRMMRTAQLYSYRQANAEVQKANADVLQGLVWCAELDGDTCASCIALHGQVFPVGSIADDHHNGRCALLPWVNGAENPIQQTGEDWFKSQPDSAQKEQMGENKWQAWQDEKFTFDKLSTTYQDEVYGEMRREASLKELVSD